MRYIIIFMFYIVQLQGLQSLHLAKYLISNFQRSKTTSNASIKYLKTSCEPEEEVGDEVMQKKNFKVALINNWPWIKIETLQSGNRVVTDGIDFKILETLAKTLNFSYEIVEEPSGVWGTTLPNGSTSGLIHLIHSGQADFSIDEITVNEAREKSIDFSFQYYMEPTTLVSKAPEAKSQAWVAFAPFNYEVWLLLLVALIFAGPVLYVMDRLSQINHKQNTMRDYSFEAFRAVALQDSKLKIVSGQGKILAGAWFLFAFLYQIFYASSLVTFLTVPGVESPTDSLGDILELLRNDKSYLIITQGTSYETLFKDAPDGIYKDIYSFFDPHIGIVHDRVNAYQYVLSNGGTYVNSLLHSEITSTKYGRTNLYFSRQYFNVQGYGVACTSGASYLTTFNRILMRLVESGLIAQWSKHIIDTTRAEQSRTVLNEVTDQGPSGLALRNLQGAFIIMGIGIILACISFVYELIRSIRKRKNNW